MIDDQAAAYLAALIDGEGTVGHQPKKWSRVVRIYNTDAGIIAQAERCLAQLGIAFSRYDATRPTPSGKQTVSLDVATRGGLTRLAALVLPLMASEKVGKIVALLESYGPERPTGGFLVRHLAA